MLFDEIEKAHPDIFNLLLQILEDGSVTDSCGRRVDFCNCVIIMTSNIGSSEGASHILGFSSSEESSKNTDNSLSALKKSFRPEFLNRVDEIIPFDPLNKTSLEKIAALMLNDVASRAKRIGIKLSFDSSVITYIVESTKELGYGARPLRRAVVRLVEDKISSEILEGHIGDGDEITITERDKEILFIKSTELLPEEIKA